MGIIAGGARFHVFKRSLKGIKPIKAAKRWCCEEMVRCCNTVLHCGEGAVHCGTVHCVIE